jgi:hypothetical protein
MQAIKAFLNLGCCTQNEKNNKKYEDGPEHEKSQSNYE